VVVGAVVLDDDVGGTVVTGAVIGRRTGCVGGAIACRVATDDGSPQPPVAAVHSTATAHAIDRTPRRPEITDPACRHMAEFGR
jgi:hypothetical protein